MSRGEMMLRLADPALREPDYCATEYVTIMTVAQLVELWLRIEAKVERYGELHRLVTTRGGHGEGHFAEYLEVARRQQTKLEGVIRRREGG